MSAKPPGSYGLSPRFYGTVNTLFVPTKSIKVEQTSYGVSDTIEITTPLNASSVDYGSLSQLIPGAAVQVLGGYGSNTPLVQGVLESLSNDYNNDVITIKARGILANLVDARVSVRFNMNDTITNVITQQIQKYGLVPKVASSTIKVGSILKDDYIATSRNMRVLDFIHMLCRTAGWTTRAVGGVIVVGPPPDTTGLTLYRNWATGDLESLHVEHNALHNRNIKVKVVSYIPVNKQRGVASKQGPLSAALGLPVPGSSLTSGAPAFKGGRQAGSTSVGERDNVEEYVIPVPNLTQQQCDDLALSIATEITRHEFESEMEFVLTASDYANVVAVSPDFNIQLDGCDQSSNNGLYFPKTVSWEWSAEEPDGLKFSVHAINHPIPAPTGGS